MSRYAGKIKVVGEDYMCFPVDPTTLEATGTSLWDPYAWTDPEVAPVETIRVSEWNKRRHAQWEKKEDTWLRQQRQS